MDTIANMLSSIKNAGRAGKESVTIPYSNLRHAIARCLKDEGYVADALKRTKKDFPVLEIHLLSVGSEPRITDVKRISKPSRRTYLGVKDIYSVKNGYGALVLSTPKGILTDKKARDEHVGGEALFEIW